MRPSLRLGVILVLILVTVLTAGTRLKAWNPATHIYIAQKVYPAYAQSPDLFYGAIAPDMAMYVPDQSKWSSAFWDTHWTATDLRLWAWNAAERAFARGWVTHNEMYAADHYAHGYPPLYLAGYVTLRARILAKMTGIPVDLAHYAVETAIDILLQAQLQQQHVNIAQQVLFGVLYHSPSVETLLKKVFVLWPLKRTDLGTLGDTEFRFNGVAELYASALDAWSQGDHTLMLNLAAAIAAQMGQSIDAAKAEALLGAAIQMCAPDYQLALNVTIKAVSLSVPR